MKQEDPLDIEGQEKIRGEAKAASRRASEDEESDFRWLMSSRQGRRMVWRFLSQAGVFRPSFSPEAMQMAFNEGRKDFGHRMLSLVHTHCPELYPTMVKENRNAGKS